MKEIFNNLQNLIYPPKCLLCDCLISENGYLCSKCWSKINFISKPYCNMCGFPLDASDCEDVSCMICIYKKPAFNSLRAVMHYDEHSKKLITRFKYSDKTNLSITLGKWLATIGKNLLNQTDYLTPVPLHKFRLITRKYNQAALLCTAMNKNYNKQILFDAIIRTKNTKPQATMTKKKRLNNVKSAFKINPKIHSKIEGKNIILVDDVITTGATIEACAKVLYLAGAKSVDVLVVAKTVIK